MKTAGHTPLPADVQGPSFPRKRRGVGGEVSPSFHSQQGLKAEACGFMLTQLDRHRGPGGQTSQTPSEVQTPQISPRPLPQGTAHAVGTGQVSAQREGGWTSGSAPGGDSQRVPGRSVQTSEALPPARRASGAGRAAPSAWGRGRKERGGPSTKSAEAPFLSLSSGGDQRLR